MTRISETNLKPNGNRTDRNNTIVHIHLDDHYASNFMSLYDKVFLCKADITFFRYGFSQTYIFYIYVMDDGMDEQLAKTHESYEKYIELRSESITKSDIHLSYAAAGKFVNACRIMEKYLSEKNEWDYGSFLIEDFDCKIISKEESKKLNSEVVRKMFGYL